MANPSTGSGRATTEPEQLALVPSTAPARKQAAKPAKPAQAPAPGLPVARVVVDSGLAHLDRPFDYLVPEQLSIGVVPGCRVKVRFAGRLVDGFVVERVERSDHAGRLAFLAKVVSSEPVLAPEVLVLARAVADRYAGALGDVLRLAVPPRHARAEKAARSRVDDPPPVGSVEGWQTYVHGLAFVASLRAGDRPRAWLTAVPGPDPARLVAEAVLATLGSGRGAVVCVPDVRDVARWDAVFTEVLGEGRHVALTAAQQPADRYRSFLAASRGDVQVVLGTRAAAFAPVRELGLVAMWDDGDDMFAEPRAPYPHAREVLLLRASQQETALLVGGYARTAEGQSLIESGWCTELVAERGTRRKAWPRLDVTDGSTAGSAPVRLPHEAFRAIRAAEGSVLVQVPRRGYRDSLSCQTCREPARCPDCQGPMGQPSASSAVTCRWCGRTESPWTCPHCRGHQLRSPVVGALRTAEEFARAFPDREVVTSGGASVLPDLPAGRRLVLATPGAEPHVEGGYDVVILLDTWLMMAREDVRVDEESHRRWFNALALARPGGRAVAVGDALTLQALVRADPAGFAARELAARAETHLPPTARLATVDGPDDVLAALAERDWTPTTEVLGPVPVDQRSPDAGQRLILRAPRREGAALADALAAVAAERSAAKLPGLRIQVDPPTF
ncbi:primosomal protein N' [Aeromicrobium wangtongii]|uniref:Probable replication restart protein PriA n=1 Tax=Aeromicrobium wangtongii TaxID=2969247 RepID=A0ABY5M1V5_9ACTN|nr:primosomal protein N' [Aeromicrobium wangtongii]MCD9198156.1 primosomal protein N' [Aeromicrobium wangtongii]UUP12195.1 primosomal protein N' [Aeromicrobium wangtongii]